MKKGTPLYGQPDWWGEEELNGNVTGKLLCSYIYLVSKSDHICYKVRFTSSQYLVNLITNVILHLISAEQANFIKSQKLCT